MALNLNTQYYREFTDPETLDTMRISLIPGFNDYYSGTMPSVELPPDFILKGHTLISGYEDDLPLGRQLANEFEIEFDLRGLYARGSTDWTELRDLVVTGVSTAKSGTGTVSTVLGQSIYMPNVWKLENRTDSKILFLGTQEELPSVTYTHKQLEPVKIKALGIESYVYTFVTNALLKANERYYRAVPHSYTTPYIYYLDYMASGENIQVKWNSSYSNEKNNNGTTINLKPYYFSVTEMTDYMLNYLAEPVLKAILRDTTATIGITDNYLVSHNVYKQSELLTNLRTTQLTSGSEVFQMNYILNSGAKDVIEDNKDSGLFYDKEVGWIEDPNVWDILISLCEQGICRLTADYNDTDDLTMIFEKPFQSSSGAITGIQTDSATLEKGYGYCDNFSLTRTGTYKNDVNELDGTGRKTNNTASYDIRVMFEIIGNSGKFEWSTEPYHIQAQDVPNMRGLYYKDTAINGKECMKIIHPRIDIDLGDSLAVFNMDETYFQYLPEKSDRDSLNNNYSFVYLGWAVTIGYFNYTETIRAILRNRKQALILVQMPTSLISNLDIGKSYTFDTDQIVTGLNDALEQKCVLTGISADYSTGIAECSFYLRGENGV